jgi:hypothetical protein
MLHAVASPAVVAAPVAASPVAAPPPPLPAVQAEVRAAAIQAAAGAIDGLRRTGFIPFGRIEIRSTNEWAAAAANAFPVARQDSQHRFNIAVLDALLAEYGK